MGLLYRIGGGQFFLNGEPRWKGYSGYPPYVNDVSAVQKKGLGPIPPGQYSIGEPYQSPNVGPFTMALEAMPGTETFGRGDFRIHGDSSVHPGAASHGCIILPRKDREALYATGEKILTVEV